jgi:hypothetical protein
MSPAWRRNAGLKGYGGIKFNIEKNTHMLHAIIYK